MVIKKEDRSKMNKNDILLEICSIVPIEVKRAKELRYLRKEDLLALLNRLKQKEEPTEPLDLHICAELERKHDLCEKCDHLQHTLYGMPYCNAERRIVSTDPLHGVTFESLPNPPRYTQITVTVRCTRFLPRGEGGVRQLSLAQALGSGSDHHVFYKSDLKAGGKKEEEP